VERREGEVRRGMGKEEGVRGGRGRRKRNGGRGEV